MVQNLATVAYLAAAVLFILSLGGLSHQETARRGNHYGIAGMILAILATAALADVSGWNVEAWALVGGTMVVGGGIGALLAARVAMTGMPQLVAILHSFVGLAAVLVGLSSFYHPAHALSGGALAVHLVEIWAGVAIGAITFTGSIVAWAKLRGSLSGAPLLLPGRHAINAALVAFILGMGAPFLMAHLGGEAAGPGPAVYIWSMTALAGILGAHLVLAIGGADMPVVVSLLNSYSGWAAAAAGFMLGNDLLIVTGALVGASGAILSYIMCEAMNRSIWNVVFGGFGTESGGGAPIEGEVTEASLEQVTALANKARSVVIVPGYGMAVARAQHLVNDLSKLLRARGVKVQYAIHPVAGRLPGHMNVLLAEAGVPYDIVLEMEEIDADLPRTDLVLVVGANDIVNPAAYDDPTSPIYGMPVLRVWESGTVIVLKRGMSAGYAGVGNPLFVKANTRMLFGDATDSLQALLAALRG